MKTIEEKIQEKKKNLDEINTTINMSMELYQTITLHYNELYGANQGKVDAKHISGISSLLSKITEAIKTRNEIQNEINALEELEESSIAHNKIEGTKEALLKLVNKNAKSS